MHSLDTLYNDTTGTVTVNLDSMIQHYCDETTMKILDAYPEVKTMAQTNKQLLYDEIGFKVYKRVTDSLQIVKKDYLWRLVFSGIRKNNHKKALTLLDAYGILIAEKEKLEELAMLRKGLQEALDEGTLMEKSKTKTGAEGDTSQVAEKKELPVDSTQSKPPVKKRPAEDMHEQIGALIDDLIAKRDFIGAYRGVKAYEKLLKDNYDDTKINTIITDLEKLIIQEHGKKFLKKLQNDLSY